MTTEEKLLMLARALAAYSVRKHSDPTISVDRKHTKQLIMARPEEERECIRHAYARALKRLIRQLAAS
jgi:hypothetical protein